MIVVGLGVAAYRGDHGELPESLSDLAPDYLKTVPTDAHSDQPFLYVRENPQLARITSWGANHVDDAGGSHNDDQILELR
jgi:hypothetical protein